MSIVQTSSDDLDEVGREDSFASFELASPPGVRVVALFGDSDDLTLLERQVPGL